MGESVSGLTVVQLQEIKKWTKMGFSQGQIAKKMGLRQPKVSAACKFIKERPFL